MDESESISIINGIFDCKLATKKLFQFQVGNKKAVSVSSWQQKSCFSFKLATKKLFQFQVGNKKAVSVSSSNENAVSNTNF